MNEGEVVKREEVYVHEVSGYARVNEGGGVDSLILSQSQDGKAHISIAG